MRVSQIQNLTWGANVLVLGGLVFVGMRFLEVNRRKPAKEPVWEKAKGGPDDAAKRWPGELKEFDPIWKTNVSGKVPPPPPPPDTRPVKVDRVAAFKAKITYLGGWAAPTKPAISTANVKFDSKTLSISPGASLDDFQLVQFTIVEKPDPAHPGRTVSAGRLVFRNPENGLPVEIEQVPPQNPVVFGPPEEFVKRASEFVKPPDRAARLERTAFQDPATGEWHIPDEEQVWFEHFGEKDLLASLAAKPVVDANGVPHGLAINGIPEAGTPLAPTHGIGTGDVVKSINGVEVHSKEDIALYLRGPGRGLERYEVVVSTNGAERKVVYNVPRRRR